MEALKRFPFLAVCSFDIVLFIISLGLDCSNYGCTYYQGIWCGMFYLAAGTLGLILALGTQINLMPKITLIAGCLAVVFGIVAVGVSGWMASVDCGWLSDFCKELVGKQWALMAMSLLAVIDSAILVVLVRRNAS